MKLSLLLLQFLHMIFYFFLFFSSLYSSSFCPSLFYTPSILTPLRQEDQNQRLVNGYGSIFLLLLFALHPPGVALAESRMAQLKIRTGVVFFFFYCYNVSPLLDSTVSYHVALDPWSHCFSFSICCWSCFPACFLTRQLYAFVKIDVSGPS